MWESSAQNSSVCGRKWFESFNSLHPQMHQCDLSLAMKFRGFPDRAIKHVWNGVRPATLILTLTFTSLPLMFVLVTNLSDTGGKISSEVSADPWLPLLVCVTGAFLASMTSASFCACVGSHEFVVTSRFYLRIPNHNQFVRNPLRHHSCTSCVYSDRGWLHSPFDTCQLFQNTARCRGDADEPE